MTPSDSRPPADSGARRKSVLYCPDCGHRSLVDGDWRVERISGEVGHERVRSVCPDCGHVIDARRPRRFARA